MNITFFRLVVVVAVENDVVLLGDGEEDVAHALVLLHDGLHVAPQLGERLLQDVVPVHHVLQLDLEQIWGLYNKGRGKNVTVAFWMNGLTRGCFISVKTDFPNYFFFS